MPKQPYPEIAMGQAGQVRERTDVLVFGGGPAGSSAALALARAGLEVTLLERSKPGTQARCETLPPEICLPLTELDLWERFQTDGPIPSPGMTSSWGEPGLVEIDFLLNPLGRGWHIERQRFDAMLLRAASEAGVIFRRDAVVTAAPEWTPRGWLMALRLERRKVEFQAGFLIDATGRAASPIRRLAGRRKVYDRMVGVAGVVVEQGEAPCSDRRALIEATEDGWWYTAPLPDGREIAAIFLTDADLLSKDQGQRSEQWRNRLRRASYTARRLETCRPVDEVRIVTASSSRACQVAGPGWLAVGDAAATWDPLCGQGVIRALESGLLAASAVVDAWQGSHAAIPDYAQVVSEEFAIYLGERAAYYRLERRWQDSPFWRRRHDTHQRRIDSAS